MRLSSHILALVERPCNATSIIRDGRIVATVPSVGIRSLTSHPPALEQLFMRHYQHDLADATSGGQP